MRIAVSLIYIAILLAVFDCSNVDSNSNGGTKDCKPPMDAREDGDCEMIIGYKWDGEKCVLMGGCGCVGDDCKDVVDYELECQVTNYLCLGLSLCGGPDNLSCTNDEYCFGGGGVYPNYCGEPGSLGICKQRPKQCPEANGSATPTPCCGCDGNYYESRCEAYLAGTDYAYTTNNGSCE